jgi:hypothetical protein
MSKKIEVVSESVETKWKAVVNAITENGTACENCYGRDAVTMATNDTPLCQRCADELEARADGQHD